MQTNELVTIPAQPIALYDNLASQVDAISTLGKWIAHSGMIAETKLEQCNLIAFTCLSERITPIEFFRKYDIVSGKLSQKSASMLAEFRAKYGGDFRWLAIGDDGKEAKLSLTYRGHETQVSYSIKDATQAGLVGGKNPNWKTRPGEMLRARCITKGLRMVCPEIAAGVYSPEEIGDIQATEPVAIEPVTNGDPLSANELAELERILSPMEDIANQFLRSKGFIGEKYNFRDMEVKRARGTIAEPEPLLERLRQFEKELAGKETVEVVVESEVAS